MKVGFSFGFTSAIITTTGLIVGLYFTTSSELAVIGGILTIAVADSLSDALGIHISEESEHLHTATEIWISTISTFVAKLLFSLTFLIPILLFTLPIAVLVDVCWGLFLLAIFSWFLAKAQKSNPWGVVGEHLAVAVVVIILTYLLGQWIGNRFG